MNWVKDEVGAGGFGGQVIFKQVFKRSFKVFTNEFTGVWRHFLP